MFMEEWNEKLIAGIQRDHLELVDRSLRNGADVNSVDSYGNTPLANAAQRGDVGILSRLISEGADVDKVGATGKSPLSRAAYWGHLNAVEYLLSQGADLNAVNPDGNTPLALAVQHNQMQVVEYLTTVGANISKMGRKGKTPLSWAVLNENLEMIEFLLDNGGFLTIHTAFLDAIQTKNLKIVQLLRERGARVNIEYKNGYTPLTKAIELDSAEIVDELVRNGASVGLCDGNGNLPLAKALEKSNIEITKYLLENGADVKAVQLKFKNFHLLKCLETKKFDMVKLLIDHGANMEIIGELGYSPLTKSVEMENFQMVKYLVERGANVNQVDDNQNTALAIAASNCDLRIFDYLIKNGGVVSQATSKIQEMANDNEDFALYLKLINDDEVKFSQTLPHLPKTETVPASWNNTRWPQNSGLRWLYASRLSSCGLSFYRSLFSSFSFPFPSIPLFFFSASITVRQSQFCFPFVPVICRNVIFFSPFPQPSSFVRVCVQPMRSCGKWPLPSIVRYDARTHRDFSATSSVNFPVGEIQCKQTGAMIVHLSF
ncbi:ankyrin repeat domain-containing protein 50-like isoform X1 [Tenebrio molitor]|uniref:ankyrin repeat domain-containing protein 50-like isoform X1 n=1 Tax=Tenebrio molitor TaxID=7067 RepID=UPI0036246CD0